MSAASPRAGRIIEILDRPGRRIAYDAAWRFAANAAFPRLCHRARWASRLGPRGSAAYVLANAAGGAVLVGVAWHVAQRLDDARSELEAELGREPTETEVAQRLGWDPPPAQG